MFSKPNDEFEASFNIEKQGYYFYFVESWIDYALNWQYGIGKKIQDNQFVKSELLEGIEYIKPLSIKRFIQMKLSRIKTDKSDAKMICLYGQERDLPAWIGYTKNQMECFQMFRVLETYTKQSTAYKNKLQAQQTLGNPSKLVVKSLERSLKNLQKEFEIIEKELLVLVKTDYQEILTKLESIPNIGRKTAVMVVVLTDGFTKFESAAQLCSFCGLTPSIRQSGTSIHGRSRISKGVSPC